MTFSDPALWLAVWQIVIIDLLLSGDNAVVIAMACRALPERQRKMGIILGALAAVALRVLFAGVVTQLMLVPLLKLAGGIALFWIAIKLVVPEEEGHGEEMAAAATLWTAVRLIVVADVVMSLDNVIAIAGAAKGSIGLIVFGLLLSIPLIMAGSSILLKVIDRWPVIIWAGAALLGWIGGELIIEDPFVKPFVPEAFAKTAHYLAAGAGAALVLAVGYLILRRRKAAAEAAA